MTFNPSNYLGRGIILTIWLFSVAPFCHAQTTALTLDVECLRNALTDDAKGPSWGLSGPSDDGHEVTQVISSRYHSEQIVLNKRGADRLYQAILACGTKTPKAAHIEPLVNSQAAAHATLEANVAALSSRSNADSIRQAQQIDMLRARIERLEKALDKQEDRR